MSDTPAARPEKDRPWVMRTYAGHSSAAESNKLYRMNLAKGQTGLSVAFDLPTQTGYDPDSPLARGEVGKVGVPIPHLGEMRRLFEDIPLTEMNTSMTINATAMWLLALYQVVAEEQNPDLEPLEVAHQLAGTTQNDIIKEYLSRGHLRLPAGALPAADLRRHLLHRQRDPEVEPDQHLQLPPAGGRRDADPGARLRAVHGDRRPRHRQGLRPGGRGGLRQGGRPHLLLRQRRRALRRGDVQDARLRRALGRDHPRALRRHRREDAPLPLRRPGQLARADRGAAGEQRAAHRARDARRHAEQERPRPRRTAAGVERGPRPAASVGPAVVAAAAAGAGLRVRPAGVRRPLRGIEGRRGQGRASSSTTPVPRWTGSRRWAEPSRPSSPAT